MLIGVKVEHEGAAISHEALQLASGDGVEYSDEAYERMRVQAERLHAFSLLVGPFGQVMFYSLMASLVHGAVVRRDK